MGSDGSGERGQWPGTARLLPPLAALLLLALLLNLPGALAAGRAGLLATLPLELALLTALLLALPGPPRPRLAWGLAGLLLAAAALQAMDQAMVMLLGRPLNLVLDLQLAPSLWDLLAGGVGRPAALLVLAGAFLTLVGLLFACRWSLDRLGRPRAPRLALLLAVLAPLIALTPPAWRDPPPVSAHLSRGLGDQAVRLAGMLADRSAFRRLARQDPLAGAAPRPALDRLGGADVLLIFVESYGRTALSAPAHAARSARALAGIERVLARRGLQAVSGWLRSPTIGGQSWLAHSSLLSGLWLDSQLRYDLLVSSGRRLLPSFFAEAGWRTALVMPAITLPWPEADHLGFAERHFQPDMGYAGKPYNWVTMPDQYTLSFFERRVRGDGDGPLFAMLALISSHAPWTPIAPVLDDWSAIGDGRVFSRWADSGEPPERLWRDLDKVRRHYGLAVDYVLRVLAGFLDRPQQRASLVLIVGDHEPGTIVAGPRSTRQVPWHVIASDPDLLIPFRAWGLTPGMRPAEEAPVRRMDSFRDWFLTAFSGPPETAAARFMDDARQP